ncbi:MAG TPA: alpha/beta hydrolase [Anaerolineales bacterium]|jgi:pimeloyl-ACP methyl ester carboxylesterase|nr:alpha/beta hydrolase [Anaerolineales bacterium]
MVEIEQRLAKVGPLTVHYEVTGEGPAVVLLHGLSGSGRWWAHNIRALAQRYRVYNVDVIGFGRSRGQRLVLREAGAWLVEWLQVMEIQRAHLVGHSMGGYIATEVAATASEVVRRLVLVDALVLPMGPGLVRHALDLARAARFMGPNFLPVLVSDFLRAGPRTMWRATREVLSADLSNRLGAVQAETLVIWGEHDSLLDPAFGRMLAEQLARAHFVCVEGAGHNPMWDRPQRFNELVLDFLAEDD